MKTHRRVNSTALLRFHPRLFLSDGAGCFWAAPAALRAPTRASPPCPPRARSPPRGCAASAPPGAHSVRAARPGERALPRPRCPACPGEPLRPGSAGAGGRARHSSSPSSPYILNCFRRHPSLFVPCSTAVTYLLFKRLFCPIKKKKIIAQTQPSNLHLVPLVQGCA